jgi:hypothetical protein
MNKSVCVCVVYVIVFIIVTLSPPHFLFLFFITTQERQMNSPFSFYIFALNPFPGAFNGEKANTPSVLGYSEIETTNVDYQNRPDYVKETGYKIITLNPVRNGMKPHVWVYYPDHTMCTFNDNNQKLHVTIIPEFLPQYSSKVGMVTNAIGLTKNKDHAAKVTLKLPTQKEKSVNTAMEIDQLIVYGAVDATSISYHGYLTFASIPRTRATYSGFDYTQAVLGSQPAILQVWTKEAGDHLLYPSLSVSPFYSSLKETFSSRMNDGMDTDKTYHVFIPIIIVIVLIIVFIILVYHLLKK